MISVKLEPRTDDEEINRLAATIAEQHRQKSAAQQQQQQQQQQTQRIRSTGQANITSYFSSSNNGANGGSEAVASSSLSRVVSETGNKHEQVIDADSARGRFGWSVIGGVSHPCVFRTGNERFCPVRSVEKFILSGYLQKLPMDVCNCTSIKSYFVTENEAKLLNEINISHCEHYFGREAFTSKDCIVRVTDAIRFSEFLALCERKLVDMQSRSDDRCGFLRINGESVVPFTIKNVRVGGEERNVRFVPLFYFEGETEHLKHKAQQLTGWDLAYLKLCCKVQGIRSELFQSDTCDVVSLSDVKRHFPVGTQFQTWWPIKKFEFKLTNQSKPSFWECQPPPSSSQVSAVVHRTSNVANRSAVPSHHVSSSRAMPTLTAMPTSLSRPQLQNSTALSSSSSSSSQATANAWATGRIMAGMLASQQQQQQPQSQHRSSTVAQQLQQLRTAQSSAVPQSVSSRPIVSTGTAAQLFMSNGVLAAVNGSNRQQQQQQPVQSNMHSRLDPAAISDANWLSQQQQHRQQQQLLSQMGFTGAGLTNYGAMAAAVLSRQQSMCAVNGAAVAALSAVPRSTSNTVSRQAPPLLPMSAANKQPASATSAAADNNWTLDSSRLHVIPASSASSSSPFVQRPTTDPYRVQKIVIDGHPIHCVNGRPYDHSQPHVNLHELVRMLFPKLGVRAFHEILLVLGVPVYRASAEQLLVLGLSGSPLPPDRVVGLLRYCDLLTFMPQICYIYTSHTMVAQQQQQVVEAAAAKRLRTC